MVDETQRLTEAEKKSLLAEWAYIKQRARFLALALGFPDPFPTRKERRKEQEVDHSQS